MLFDLAEPCLLCGRRSPQGLCRLCAGELRDGGALYDPLCRCGLPGTEQGGLCGRCQWRASISASRSAWSKPLASRRRQWAGRGQSTSASGQGSGCSRSKGSRARSAGRQPLCLYALISRSSGN